MGAVYSLISISKKESFDLDKGIWTAFEKYFSPYLSSSEREKAAKSLNKEELVRKLHGDNSWSDKEYLSEIVDYIIAWSYRASDISLYEDSWFFEEYDIAGYDEFKKLYKEIGTRFDFAHWGKPDDMDEDVH